MRKLKTAPTGSGILQVTVYAQAKDIAYRPVAVSFRLPLLAQAKDSAYR